MTGWLFFGAFCILAGLGNWAYRLFRKKVNTSADRTEYNPYKEYYSVPLTAEDIRASLSIPFSLGRFTSSFSGEEGVLVFQTHLGAKETCEYRLRIDDMGSFSIVTVTPVIPAFGKYKLINMQSFLQNKLGAVRISDRDMRPHT